MANALAFTMVISGLQKLLLALFEQILELYVFVIVFVMLETF